MHTNKKYCAETRSPKGRLVSTLLIILLTISNIFAFSKLYAQPKTVTTDQKLESAVEKFAKDYPLLDPGRVFVSDENLILNIQDLREYMKSLPDREKDWAEITAYLEILNTGANITVNPDAELFPASLAKLPVAMVIMRKVQDRKLDFETKIQMTSEDADTIRTPDIVREIGRSYDVKFLLTQLLIDSDNTAYRMLKRQITEEELRGIGESVGLEELFSPDGKISAKDYTRLLRALYTAGYLKPDKSEELLSLMNDSKFKDFLRAGIPNEVPFAHKWGTNIAYKIYSDSGIVYVPKRPYMVSVMIQCKLEDIQECESKSNALMKEVGQKTYNFVVQLSGKK